MFWTNSFVILEQNVRRKTVEVNVCQHPRINNRETLLLTSSTVQLLFTNLIMEINSCHIYLWRSLQPTSWSVPCPFPHSDHWTGTRTTIHHSRTLRRKVGLNLSDSLWWEAVLQRQHLRPYIVHMSAVCESITWRQFKIENLPDDSWKPTDGALFTDWIAVTAGELGLLQCNWTLRASLFPQEPTCYQIYQKHKATSLCFVF